MQVTSLLSAILCFVYASVVWSNCYTPIGRLISGFEQANRGGLRYLDKCADSDICCWSDQTCLADLKLCNNSMFGLVRESCSVEDWNSDSSCSQLCLDKRNNSVAQLRMCKKDKRYCCSDISDDTLFDECCDNGLGFLIDLRGNALKPDGTPVDEETFDAGPSGDAVQSTSASSSSSSSATTSTSSSSTGDATQTAANDNPAGLSTGANAGIGVGVGVLVCAAAALGVYLVRRNRMKKNAAALLGRQDSKTELDGTSAPPTELPADSYSIKPTVRVEAP